MGTYRENGYSAAVDGYLVVDGKRVRLAKANGSTLFLAEPSHFLPGVRGDLLITVDGKISSYPVRLPDGVGSDQTIVSY